MIVVDSKEASKASKIVSALKKDFEIKIEDLFTGDYHILSSEAKGFIVERKTTTDLVHTLRTNRLWDQLRRLSYVSNAKPLLLLESSISKIKKFTGFSLESVIALLTSITLDWNIPIVFSSNVRSTVYVLAHLARKASKKKASYYSIRYVRKALSLNDQARSIIEGFPMISASKSVALLKHFRTVKNVVNASFEELKHVPGIGTKLASKIVEVVNHEFKEE